MDEKNTKIILLILKEADLQHIIIEIKYMI